MSEWDYEIPTGLPSVEAKDKLVIYLPDGRLVVIKQPVGFARHPSVPCSRNVNGGEK